MAFDIRRPSNQTFKEKFSKACLAHLGEVPTDLVPLCHYCVSGMIYIEFGYYAS